MIHEIVFSCAGTTRGIADKIAQGLGGEIAVLDLADKNFNDVDVVEADDVAVFAVPVWGGRVPALATEHIKRIKGSGQKAVAVVVYGNRDYDDALLELCDIVSGQGFTIVSAAAFVAEHCIFPTVATKRPDVSDHVAISRFVNETKSLLSPGKRLDLSMIKGNRPYKKAAGVPLHPSTDEKKCVKCHTCVEACPYGAIDMETLKTVDDKCTSCTHCISICKQGARGFSGIMYKTVRFGFEKMCGKRREPEIFI